MPKSDRELLEGIIQYSISEIAYLRYYLTRAVGNSKGEALKHAEAAVDRFYFTIKAENAPDRIQIKEEILLKLESLED